MRDGDRKIEMLRLSLPKLGFANCYLILSIRNNIKPTDFLLFLAVLFYIFFINDPY